MGVPRWIIWLVSAVSATWHRTWVWNWRWGWSQPFGLAWEFPQEGHAVAVHTDPWTKDNCHDCFAYPIVTLYYRIRLWPPSFIDRPIVDVFPHYDCNKERVKKTAVSPPRDSFSRVAAPKLEGHPFVCLGGFR